MRAFTFDALIDDLADLLFEVRRRVDDRFARMPLALPAVDDTRHLGAAPDCTPRALVQAIAHAAQVPTRDASDAQPDAVRDLLLLQLEHACNGCAPAESGLDWRQRVAARVEPRLKAHVAMQAPSFLALPGLQRIAAADGSVHYLRCGNGDATLLLVNAFGLTMDIWHDLAMRLSPRFTLLAIDEDPPASREGVPRVSYATPDSLQRLRHAVQSVLASEKRSSLHVASWCSGAKLAIELARAEPQAVASLALFAPSFAGAESPAGSDSAYEMNLHTMCKLVDRMPQSADSMARSMTALMAKNAADDEDLFALADATTLPWLQRPFASAANMVEYSRQLLHFRAHRLGPNPGCEPLALPVLLVTGERDHATSSVRARDICNELAYPLHFELRAGSHYFIHQNSTLVAQLLDEFIRSGARTSLDHPRLHRTETPQALVCGEL